MPSFPKPSFDIEFNTDAEPFEADSQLCGVTEDNRPEESEDMKMKCPSFYPLGLRLRPQSAPDH